jgi:hypothetical protein
MLATSRQSPPSGESIPTMSSSSSASQTFIRYCLATLLLVFSAAYSHADEMESGHHLNWKAAAVSSHLPVKQAQDHSDHRHLPHRKAKDGRNDGGIQFHGLVVLSPAATAARNHSLGTVSDKPNMGGPGSATAPFTPPPQSLV